LGANKNNKPDPTLEKLIGRSKPIQKIRKKIQQLARSHDNIIIIGEQGVGKSIVARNIHGKSEHSLKPVVRLAVNTKDELGLSSTVRAILTNHEFLNLDTSPHGNFALPDGTTLILDGVETLSIPGQRMIVELVEGLEKQHHRIRIMMLLQSNFKELIRDGRMIGPFGKTLKRWHRIEVPPLRERPEDIPELVEHFVRGTTKELKMGEMVIDINAISLLVRKEWKGNVKELKAFVEQAIMLSEDKETFALPPSLIDEQSELSSMLHQIDDGIGFALDRSMELIERRILERVLRKFGFNQSRAARFLKITEDTLRYRMKKLGIALSQDT